MKTPNLLKYILTGAAAGLILMWSVGAFAGVDNGPATTKTETTSTSLLNPVVDLNGCTAFYIGDNRFLTAGHCIGKSPESLKFSNGSTDKADVIAWSDPDVGMADWALLETTNDYQTKNIEPFELNCSYKATVGDELKMTGFPAAFEGTLITQWGRVNAEEVKIKRSPWSLPLIGFNGTSAGGFSGSPVFLEESNEVVGILVGSVNENKNLALLQPVSAFCKVFGLK